MGESAPGSLADLEPEEVFLDNLSHIDTSTPGNKRRLSATGSASRLKDRNLIPPLNTPTSRRVSLPRATKTVLVVNPGPLRKMPTDKPQQPQPPKAQAPDPSAAILERMEVMFRGLREDIAKSESNTGRKIDDLSTKLNTRLTKAEKDLSTLGLEVSSSRKELDSLKAKLSEHQNSLPGMIEEAVSNRIKSRAAETETGRRPRLLGASRTDPSDKEEKYWDARASLRMWPVAGQDLAAAVIEFLTTKLQCPPGMVNITDVEGLTRIVPRPGALAADQVVVRFSSVRLRDEIKALTRNLDGTDKLTGVQIEPPDFLRTQYQTFQRLAYQMKKKHPSLKRSIRFSDNDFSLTMSVLTARGSEWKTIEFPDAKATMKKTRSRVDSMSREELEEMVDLDGTRNKRRRTLADSDDSDMEDDDNDITIVESNVNRTNNTKSKASCNALCFINGNARSLRPKIDSLYDCFLEKVVDIAFITETWFQDGRELDNARDYLKENYALGLLARNRDRAATNGRLYGGVAVVHRLKSTSLKEFPLVNPEGYEVLAAVGKVGGLKGKTFCLACYAPPNITPARAKLMLEFISDVISEGKRNFPECSIIVSGDFNQWEAEKIVEEHPDMREVEHGPTRDDMAIDRSFVNFARSITEAGTLPPLETEDERPSDHRIAFARAEFERKRVKSITYTYRQYSELGATSFLEELGQVKWEGIKQARGSQSKVDKLQDILSGLMSKHFKLKTTTRRASDPPWFNDRILWLIKKRRKIYDKEGRSARYKTIRKRSDKLSRDRASAFLKQQRLKMTSHDSARNFYRNVKAFNTREKPPEFDVRDLYPDSSDKEVAESLAAHFNAISSEFNGLSDSDIPSSIDLALPVLEVDQVAKLKNLNQWSGATFSPP